MIVFFASLLMIGSSTDILLEWDGIAPSAVPLQEIIQIGESALSKNELSKQALATVHLRIADAHYYCEDDRAARRHYERALRVMPDSLEGRWKLGWMEFKSEGRRNEAQKIAATLMQDHPAYGFGYFLDAAIKLDDGDSLGALKSFDKCIALQPHFQTAHIHRAMCLFRLDRSQDALNSLRQGAIVAPALSRTHNALSQAFGVVLLRLGRFDEASPHLTILMGKDQKLELSDLLMNWVCHGQLEKRATCQLVSEQMVKRFPNSAESHWMHSRTLLAINEIAKADKEAQIALNIRPTSSSLATLALVKHLQGDYLESSKTFVRAMQARPVDPDTALRAAFLLATCPDGQVRHGKVALKLVEQTRAAIVFHEQKEVFSLIESCVLAENGMFDHAVSVLKPIAEKGTSRGAQAKRLMQMFADRQTYLHNPLDSKDQIFFPPLVMFISVPK